MSVSSLAPPASENTTNCTPLPPLSCKNECKNLPHVQLPKFLVILKSKTLKVGEPIGLFSEKGKSSI